MTRTEKLLQVKNIPYLLECFDTSKMNEGRLFWNERPRSHFKSDHAQRAFNSRHAGNEAGRKPRGHYYRTVVVKDPDTQQTVYVNMHRLIWLLEHGEAPPPTIDHRNRITTDNRPKNLRSVTQKQNRRNSIGHAESLSEAYIVATDRGTFVATFRHPDTHEWTREFDSKFLALTFVNYLSWLFETDDAV